MKATEHLFKMNHAMSIVNEFSGLYRKSQFVSTPASFVRYIDQLTHAEAYTVTNNAFSEQ